MATRKIKTVEVPDYKFFGDYGNVKMFYRKYKPECLKVRYGAENPYVTYNVNKLRLLPKWLPNATVRYFYIMLTEYGVTLFVTLW